MKQVFKMQKRANAAPYLADDGFIPGYGGESSKLPGLFCQVVARRQAKPDSVSVKFGRYREVADF
jgi:hypothetical protein